MTKYDFKRFRLKPEYRQLFKNLADGADFETTRRLFQDPASDPQPKSYQDVEQAERERDLIDKLNSAGFLEVDSRRIRVVDSPFDEEPKN